MRRAVRWLPAAAVAVTGIYVAPFLPGPDCWPLALKRVATRTSLPEHHLGDPQPKRQQREHEQQKEQEQGLQHLRDESSSINRLSVVVPVYNEGAQGVRRLVESLYSAAQDPRRLEIVLIDANCKDDSFADGQDALQRKAPNATLRIEKSTSGRGQALQRGAQVASAEKLLFVHSDCVLPLGYDVEVCNALANERILMTAFSFGINDALLDESREDTAHLKRRFRRLERLTNMRARWLWLPYGDQTFGIRRDEYHRLGGFEAMPMMEDFALVTKARGVALHEGSCVCILESSALCSPRRWQDKGILANSLRNWMFVAAFVLGGLTPEEIFRMYYRSS